MKPSSVQHPDGLARVQQGLFRDYGDVFTGVSLSSCVLACWHALTERLASASEEQLDQLTRAVLDGRLSRQATTASAGRRSLPQT